MNPSVRSYISKFFVMLMVTIAPKLAHASVETMMSNLQSVVLEILAPIVCVCGIVLAGFKLAMGDESAKRMLMWSCLGCVITFTAPSIITFLKMRVAG